MDWYVKAIKAVIFAGALGFASAAGAATFTFDHIVESGDGSTELADGAIGEAQMTVDVTNGSGLTACPSGVDCVLFTFSNSGPDASSIVQTYWDDNANSPVLDSIAGFIDADENGGDAGVDFSAGASPPDLPGGNNVGFDADFAADADSPKKVQNGVNPNESLGVIFVLETGMTYEDVIAAMAGGDLVIGVHVQGYASGGSEAFVSSGACVQGSFDCPNNVIGGVPLPASLPLLLAGVTGFAAMSRRRRRRLS